MIEYIKKKSRITDFSQAKEIGKEGEKLFEDKVKTIISILETYLQHRNDSFIEGISDKIKALKISDGTDWIKTQSPQNIMSRDTLAMSQGIWAPPHITIIADIFHIRSRIHACDMLTQDVIAVISHMERQVKQDRKMKRIGTNIFIGHGHSYLWKDLKDFIQDRLKLPWDEFNRNPVAGITNISRLSEMLDSAVMAFLILTAEEELADGEIIARMNVVHEAGLFQGRLGFARAIILLEDGCKEFSNIHGLGQIRFPKGNINAAFEEVRLVLEREGIINP